MEEEEKVPCSAVGHLVLIPIDVVCRGFVIMKLWTWFLTPLINVPSPTILVCLGLSLLAGMFLPDYKENPKVRTFEERFGVVVFVPALFLLVGWLLTQITL